MPKPRGKQPDPYDTVFDFFFGSSKKPKPKGFPGTGSYSPALSSGFAAVAAEFAAAPGVYAIEGLIADTQAEMDALVSVKSEPIEGFKVGVAPRSLFSFITDPQGTVDKAYKKYKLGKKIGKRGAGEKKFDVAMIGIWGALAGLDARTAWDVRSMLRDQQTAILGSTDAQMSRYDAARRVENSAKEIAEKKHGISQQDMDQILKESKDVGSKSLWDHNDRRVHMMTRLRAHGLNTVDAGSLVKKVFGGNLQDQRVIRDTLMRRGYTRADADRIASHIWSNRDTYMRNKDGIYSYLKTQGISHSDANQMVEDVHGSWEDVGTWQPGFSAKNDGNIREQDYQGMMERIQLQIDNLPAGSKEQRRLIAYQKYVGRYREFVTTGKGFGSLYGIGMTIGKVQHLNDWRKNFGNNFRQILLTGNVVAIQDTFSIGGRFSWDNALNMGGGTLDYGTGVKIRNTVIRGNTVGGTVPLRVRAAEWLYYYHPVNIAKGVFWDGRMWGKLATKCGGNENLRDVFMMLGSLTPKQLMFRRKRFPSIRGKIYEKTRELLAKAFSKALGRSAKDLALLPIKELIKQLIIKVAAQLVGNSIAPVIGGIIANIGAFALEKLAKPMMQIAVMLLFSIAALLIFAGMGLFGGSKTTLRFKRHLNVPLTAVETIYEEGLEVSKIEDWSDDSQPPPGYAGNCIVSAGTQRCTQGPCGSFSHTRLGNRAVDLTWSGMYANPSVHAPMSGTVISTRSSMTCRDGTNYGGMIAFKDDNGYVWTFVHVGPAVSTGTRVNQGDVLAKVQFRPEVQSGKCWTGPHLHLQIKDSSGKYVNSAEFLNDAAIGCSFTCPAGDDC